MAVYRSEKGNDRILFANDNDKLLLIDNGGAASKILYADADSDLLKLAENEAVLSGKSRMEYRFCSRYPEDTALFAGNGYELTETKKFLSVNIADLFESKGVQKSMKIEFPGTEYIPFRELMLYQLEELENLFSLAHIPLALEDIVRFDDDLSGIVYDENMNIMSLVCASVQGREIIIECLYGTKKKDPRFIMSALQGFAMQLIFCDLAEIYNAITVLEANPTVGMLLRRLVDSRYTVRDDMRVLTATKALPKGMDGAGSMVLEADNLTAAKLEDSLEKKMKYRYYQRNINWKTDWNI